MLNYILVYTMLELFSLCWRLAVRAADPVGASLGLFHGAGNLESGHPWALTFVHIHIRIHTYRYTYVYVMYVFTKCVHIYVYIYIIYVVSTNNMIIIRA